MAKKKSLGLSVQGKGPRHVSAGGLAPLETSTPTALHPADSHWTIYPNWNTEELIRLGIIQNSEVLCPASSGETSKERSSVQLRQRGLKSTAHRSSLREVLPGVFAIQESRS